MLRINTVSHCKCEGSTSPASQMRTNGGLSLLDKLNPIDTPFDSIYSPPNGNEDHVQITSASVNFIKSKLSSINCN
jgi:hypothetical protein